MCAWCILYRQKNSYRYFPKATNSDRDVDLFMQYQPSNTLNIYSISQADVGVLWWIYHALVPAHRDHSIFFAHYGWIINCSLLASKMILFKKRKRPADNSKIKKIISHFLILVFSVFTAWKVGFALDFTRKSTFWSLNIVKVYW